MKRVTTAVAFAFAVSLFAMVPAYARAETSETDNSGSGSTSITNSLAENETETRTLSQEEIKTRVSGIKQQAEDSVKKLSAAKETAMKRTEQERQKSCEARATAITKKLNQKVADAKKHQAVFDKIFARVKEFHDNKKLTTENYDALVATTTAAQMKATNDIATLESFDTSVDCTQVGAAATKLASFKAALTLTRDSLKEYRTAIKNLTVAVKTSISTSTGTAESATSNTETN